MQLSSAAACLLLHQIPGLGPIRLSKALLAEPDPAALLRKDQHFWCTGIKIPVRSWSVISEWQNSPKRSWLTEAMHHDLRWRDASSQHNLVTRVDLHYPKILLQLADPPTVLYLKGDVALLHHPQVAIVGSRHASRAGLRHAEEFAAELGRHGWLISSGLAQGIDGAAHQACLKHNLLTMAVLGSGLEHIYPAGHLNLAEQIADRGLLVSEYKPQAAPKAGQFPQRNRILAALSEAVLVVEAAEKSGSLITARLAAEYGKDVFAMPGPAKSPFSSGCHRLIQQGAGLVTDASDLLAELPELVCPPQHDIRVEHSLISLPAAQQNLLELLDDQPVSLDWLVLKSKTSPDKLLGQLVELELAGQVEIQSGGYCRVYN